MTNNDLVIKAEFRLEDSTQGLVIVDYTDYTTLGEDYSSVLGTIKVTDPNENIIYDNTTDFSSPDMSLSSKRYSGDVTLPLNDDTNEVIEGEYEIKYKAQVGGTSYEKIFTFNYSYDRPTADIDVTIDGFSSTYQSVDSTTYNADDESNMDSSTTGTFTTLLSTRPYFAVINAVNGALFSSGSIINIYTTDADSGTVCYVESVSGNDVTVFSKTKLTSVFNKTTTYNVRPYTRRSFSVMPPSGSGMATITTDDATISYSSNIYSGTYASSLTTNVAETISSNLYVYEQITGSSSDYAYKVNIDTLREATDSLYDAYKSALTTNKRRASTLETLVEKASAQWDIYDPALRYGNNQAAYDAAAELYDILNDYVDTSSDPQEITPYVNPYETYTDEKVKVNSSDTTAGYLIDKMNTDEFEVSDGKISIKASGLPSLSDYVSKSLGGEFEGKISYDEPHPPTGDRDIPDWGYIQSQNYIDLTDISTDESNTGNILSYNSLTGRLSINSNVSAFTNDSGYITENDTITLSGDVAGSGKSSIVVTISDDSIEYGMLNDNVISGQDDLSGTGNISMTDTVLISTGSGLKKIDLTSLEDKLSDNNTLVHNDISTIQGGSATERYHMTLSEHTEATQYASGVQSGLLYIDDWTTFNNKQDVLSEGAGINISSADVISVVGSEIIDDNGTSKSDIWSANKILLELSNNIDTVIASKLLYVIASQDPINPTVLDPGASPTDGDRYLLYDVDNLNANFGTIDTDTNGNLITLQDNDIVEYYDNGESGSGNVSEFRVDFDASSASSTASVIIGTGYNSGGTSYSSYVWYWNLSEWQLQGQSDDHNDLGGLQGGTSTYRGHLSESALSALTQENGSLDEADNFHTHDVTLLTNISTYATESYVQDYFEPDFQDDGSGSGNLVFSANETKRYRVVLTNDSNITINNFAAGKAVTVALLLENNKGSDLTLSWAGITAADNWIDGDDLTILTTAKSYEVVITTGGSTATNTVVYYSQKGT